MPRRSLRASFGHLFSASGSSGRVRPSRSTAVRRRTRSCSRRTALMAESLEPRAMLATTATLSGDLSQFMLIPLTFRQPNGAVGFTGNAYVGQLSWSSMTGDAAAAGIPSTFKSLCIEGLEDVWPGRNTYSACGPASQAPTLRGTTATGGSRAGLLSAFWGQYGPATAAGFADKTDSAAFQLAVWEIIDDASLNGNKLAFDLNAGQFSVNPAGRSTQP